MTRLWHMLLLLVMGVTWGLQFSMLKFAAETEISDVELLFISMVGLALFFGALTVIRGDYFHIDKERFWFLIITGALGYVAPLAAVVIAAPYVPAGLITFIVSLTPIVTAVSALAVGVERASIAKIVSIVLGAVAAAFIVVPELSHPDLGMIPWLAVIALVPLCYGIETTYVAARWPPGFGVLQVVTGETIVAAIMLAPLFVAFGEPARLASLWSVGGIAVALVVASGVIEVTLYFYLVRKAGAIFTSFGTFVSLFAGIGWGMVVFGETHSAILWIAVALLVASLALVLFEGQRPGAASRDAP